MLGCALGVRQHCNQFCETLPHYWVEYLVRFLEQLHPLYEERLPWHPFLAEAFGALARSFRFANSC